MKSHFLLGVLFLSLSAFAWGDNPVPSRSDLSKLYDAGEYRQCLQQISKAMTGMEIRSPDRYPLLLLRGDCLIQLNELPTAKQAYEDAQRSPSFEESCEGYATVFLISKTRESKYTPRSEGEPISIANRDDRKRAMLALLNDELKISEDVNKAMSADSIKPIMDAWPKVRNLYSLEITATGTTEKVDPVIGQLGEQARAVLDRQLTLANESLKHIQEKSVEQGDSRTRRYADMYWSDPGIVRRGLSGDDSGILRDIILTSNQVAEVAQTGLRGANRLKHDPRPWNALIKAAQVTAQKAEGMLNQK